MTKGRDTAFIQQRITELRLQKNVSEYKMSLDLGQSRSYIQGISSGKVLPSMAMFLEICDYLDVTPAEFFSPGRAEAVLTQKVVQKVRELPPRTLALLDEWLGLLK